MSYESPEKRQKSLERLILKGIQQQLTYQEIRKQAKNLNLPHFHVSLVRKIAKNNGLEWNHQDSPADCPTAYSFLNWVNSAFRSE